MREENLGNEGRGCKEALGGLCVGGGVGKATQKGSRSETQSVLESRVHKVASKGG